MFCLVMFQGGLRHIATPTGGLYSQMSQIEGWVVGRLVDKRD
jgi:hypothetical protein